MIRMSDTTNEIASIPLLSLTTKDILNNCKNLKDCEDDKLTIFICSYPKSGTTWMQTILYNIISNGNQNFQHISHFSPFYEIPSTWDDHNIHSIKHNQMHKELKCRAFNTHLLWNMMPKDKNMKYIYCIRNGKDVAVSFYQHLSNQNDNDCYNGTFEEFLLDWCNDKIIFGNWIDHLSSWLNDRYNNNNNEVMDKPDILLIKYEDLINNINDCIIKINNYLNLPLLSNKQLNDILLYIDFNHMKKHQDQYKPISVPWKSGYHFIRNGKIGDNVNYFTTNNNEIYNAMINKKFPNGIPQWLLDLNVL